MKCEVCSKKNFSNLIDLGLQPIPDNLSDKREKSLNVKKFRTKIINCNYCLTAFQKKTIPQKDLFTKNYSYRARNTKDVVTGMDKLSKKIKKFTNKSKLYKILDIGCNDGTLLDFFQEKKYLTYGVEPTNAYKDCNKRHKVFNNFFDKNLAEKFKKDYGYPDVIIFTNVFAHIEKFNSLILSLKKLIGKNTLLVIENHYYFSVLKKLQFDTFYHEHLRTYSLNSFYHISKKIGLMISRVNFPNRYGGNIQIFLSNNTKHQKKISNEIDKEKKIFHSIKKKFVKKYTVWKNKKKRYILFLNKRFGPLLAKSYPARASIVINTLGLTSKNILAVCELPVSKKVNKFIPGTDIRIISDKEINKLKYNGPIINFSWHIKKEIRKYMKKININNKLIEIISNQDLK